MGIHIGTINKYFSRVGKVIVKLRWVNLILFAFVLFVSAKGLSRLKLDTSNDNWFLENSEMIHVSETFEDIFGNSDYAAILVKVDDVFQPEVLRSIRELSDEVERFTPLADEVLSLTNLEYSLGVEGGIEIINLIPDSIPIEREELDNLRSQALAKPSIVGKLLSHDCSQTWIILRLQPFPDDWANDPEYLAYMQALSEEYPQYFADFDSEKPQPPEILIGHVFAEIVGQEKYAHLHPLTSGMPMINYEKRVWFNGELPRIMLLALLLSVLVLIISLRSVRGVIFPVFCGVSAMVVVFGLQGYMGVKIDPSIITMPMLLGFAVAVGYAIHIVTFYKKGLREGRTPREAAVYAIEESGWPIMFTALTTIGALMSFLFIEVRLLRWIGLTSAALVGFTFLVTIVILPSLFSFGKRKPGKAISNKRKESRMSLWLVRLNDIVMAHPKGILLCAGFFMLAGIWGLTKVEVSFDVRRSMGARVPYVSRLLEISDTEIGALYSYEIGIEFPDVNGARDPENLRNFSKLEKEVRSFLLTKKTFSILDIVKDLNQVLNDGDQQYYSIPSMDDIPAYTNFQGSDEERHVIETQIIAQTLFLYENAGGTEAEKWMDYDGRWLHLQVDLDNYNARELQQEFNRIDQLAEELFPDANVIKSGTAAKYTVMQGIVALGQIKSFLIALGLITILLMLVFGSVKTGLIGIIPNIAPALAVGGVMGFLKIPLDMMTVTIMPMLLGLAVDDTIHFINHCHLEYERSGSYENSIRRTFFIVGPALLTTSIVLVFNFSAYFTSPANVLFNMGLLACVGIITALVADFTVTPILLKMAKVFGRIERTGEKQVD